MPTLTNGASGSGNCVYSDSITVEASSGFAQFESPTGSILAQFTGKRTFGPFNNQSFRVQSLFGTVYYEFSDGFPTGTVAPAQAVINNLGVVTGLVNPVDGSTQPLGGVGGTTIQLVATTLTLTAINGSVYNGNTIACTNASAQTITINSGAGLTGGFAVEQLGSGSVTIAAGGGVTLNAPNGAVTAGARTTLVVLQEATDVYTVLATPTADRTQTIAASGASPSLDLSLYNVFDVTMTAATVTPTFVGMVSGQAFTALVIYRQDGTGSRLLGPPTGTITYLSSAGGGTAPTLPTAPASFQVMSYLTVNAGTNWLVSNLGRS